MNIFICGQKSFGKEVLKALYEKGHNIVGVPPKGVSVRIRRLAPLRVEGILYTMRRNRRISGRWQAEHQHQCH